MTTIDLSTMRAARDPVLAAVAGVRRRLSRIVWTRCVLQSAGVGFATWLILHLLGRGRLDAGIIGTVSFLAAVAFGIIVVRQRGTVSLLRAALWIEEHQGSGYALVTWVEQSVTGASPSALLSQSVGAASRAAIASANSRLPLLARAQLAGPLLFLGGVASGLWLATRPAAEVQRIGAGRSTAVATGRRDQPIGAWHVRVTPPAYTGLSARDLGDVVSVRALSGTRIELRGRDAMPDSVRSRVLADSSGRPRVEELEALSNGWRSRAVATDGPLELRVSRDRFARLLLVEGVGDSIPRVQLSAPARDSVLRRADGVLPLEASVHDDIGLARASFDVVISSGDGERFTVRAVQVGGRAMSGQRDAVLRASLDLRALQLGPGDVVHVRAVARDRHPTADREAGASETRAFRIARASEYDSVAVEPAPPPDVDKSLLSQRMLLMLTEKLEQRRPRLTVAVVRDESGRLARDQARLRQAVGDAVFQRLTGDEGGEHSHFAGDGHDHGVEAIGGKLALSGVNAQGMLEEGDDAPVIAINKPLLEAYNAMWDAGRALEQGELRTAIPFMRIALEAIERARAASRLYLRGRPPTVIVDIAKVRLTGTERSAPERRAARTALPERLALREARLLAAALLAVTDAAAARDSLAVLRLESLADAPAFAQALTSLIEAFASTPGADVTEPFRRARRVLGGVVRIPAVPWSRGGPP
ncbi:MAG: hypothetical protein IPP90_07975 [Gemmatimonadaceae bacterium]|nr:hypothetical protein [Gemmatimonadaceae bacterium]